MMPIKVIIAYVFLKCVLRALIPDKGDDLKMDNIDINHLRVIGIKTDNKNLTGSIILSADIEGKTKATYSLSHKCFSNALTLLNNEVIVTYNPDDRIIVSVRPV